MKKLLCIWFIFLSMLAFSQIENPTPDLELESSYQNTEKVGDKWDFSKKPIKSITKINGNKVVDHFDSIGRFIERNVFWKHVTESVLHKYQGNIIVETTRKKTHPFDAKLHKKTPDETITTKLNIDDKGKIIDGKTFKISEDGISKIISYHYYDKKNRLTKSTDSTGLSGSNYYYSGDHLIRKEEIRTIDKKIKVIMDRTYQYNKDNQIVFYKCLRYTYENNIVTEKKISQTITQEFKNKLLSKKVLKDNIETIERNYSYDANKNLITFIEIKKNNADGMITAQMKRTKKYENNILVFSEVQQGLSPQQGKFVFTYYFYSDEQLSRQDTTDTKGNLQVHYYYNEYNHLIKTTTTFSNSDSQNDVVYEIEYY